MHRERSIPERQESPVTAGIDLIAQHSSWRERLAVLRHAPRSAVPRLLQPAFAPVPRAGEAVGCEIKTPDRYGDGLTALASYLSRAAPDAAVTGGSLEQFLEHHRDYSGAIGVSDLLFLHAFVNVLAPARAVEIGTLSGFSAAVLADAVARHQPVESASVLVDTIDLSERCFTDQTKRVGFEIPQLVPQLASRIRVHAGKDARHVEQIARPRELEVVFIDGDHQHPRPTLDLIRVSRFVRPGGWVVIHDIELGSLGKRMRAAGTPFEHGAPFGAQWLFEAWPFEKISGGNIGALRLPENLRELVPFALAMLRIPPELQAVSARRALNASLSTLADLH